MAGPATDKRLRRPEWWVPALASVTVLALSLHSLSTRSIWLDEALSVRLGRMSWWHGVAHDHGNMAAYYLVMKPVTRLGTGEWLVRFPSAVLAGLATALFFVLVRRLFDFRVAVIATALVAFNVSLIDWAQQARGYTLEVLVVTGAWLAFAAALERGTWKAFACYGVVATLAIYVHLFAGFFVAAQVATLLLLPAAVVPWRRVMTTLVLVGLAVLPAAIDASRHHDAFSWTPELSRHSAHTVLVFVTGSTWGSGRNVLIAAYVSAWAVGLGLLVAALRRHGRSWDAWRIGVGLMWLVVPTVGAALLAPVQSLFVPYYFIALVPAAAIVMAIAVTRLGGPRWSAAATIVLVALAASGFRGLYTEYTSTPWRSVTAAVGPRAVPGDGVAFVPSFERLSFDYYVERAGRSSRFPPVTTLTTAASRDRVWLVLAHPRAHQAEIARAVAELGSYREVNGFRLGDIQVRLFERR